MFQGVESPQVFLRIKEQDYVRKKKKCIKLENRKKKEDPLQRGPVYLCHFISSISLYLLEIKLTKYYSRQSR